MNAEYKKRDVQGVFEKKDEAAISADGMDFRIQFYFLFTTRTRVRP